MEPDNHTGLYVGTIVFQTSWTRFHDVPCGSLPGVFDPKSHVHHRSPTLLRSTEQGPTLGAGLRYGRGDMLCTAAMKHNH